MTSLLRSAAVLAVVGLLSGCVIYPYPHVGRVSPDVEGKVVDASSGAPVIGASVRLADRPKIAAVSGADGCFTLPHARNFYYLHWSTYDGIDTDIPYKKPPAAKLQISHTNYIPLEFAIPVVAVHPDCWDLRQLKIEKDIPLEPVER